jgi:hypothetical protein
MNDLNQMRGAAYVYSGSVSPFAAFSVSDLQVSTTCPCEIDLNSSFTLEASSSGINPATEPVRVQIGTLFLTIPPGSFHQNPHGNYAFQGSIDGVSIDAQFKVTGQNSYQFLFEAANAQLHNTAGSLAVVLSIGDNGGSAMK